MVMKSLSDLSEVAAGTYSRCIGLTELAVETNCQFLEKQKYHNVLC